MIALFFPEHNKSYAFSFPEIRREGLVVCAISELKYAQSGKPLVRDMDHTYYGGASCSEKDEYDKVKGMRLALHRALRASPIDKKYYADVFDEFVRRFINGGKPTGKSVSKKFLQGVTYALKKEGLWNLDVAFPPNNVFIADPNVVAV